MSSTLGVQQWFRNSGELSATAELSRHAQEFGFTFVGDEDDDIVKKECTSLPPIPPLIPLRETAGRLKQVSSDIDCDDSGESGEEPGRYGGVIMVNSGSRGSDDDERLLRLFGGGDSDSNSAGMDVSDACGASSSEGKACADGDCAVVLDPLPSDLLRSLSSEGRVSAERVEQPCISDSAVPGAGSVEVCGLLQDLVSAVANREERCDEVGRSPRYVRQDLQAGTAPPPPLPPRIDATAADVESRDDECTAPRKTRHGKSDSLRKAVRRRRERRSSSSGGSKKNRKRSTSTCSTTSSTCSNSSSARHHKHHHKHHKHRRRSPVIEEPPPTPRVNPIFVWIKQDDTRIVEVLCEDYDKRNRIRLTKTAHGWRAMPRTERLASSTVTSGDLQRQQSLSQSQQPQSSPLPSMGDGSTALGSTSPHRDEALENDQEEVLETDGSTAHQNSSTSLVPTTTPDCPSASVSEETKEDDVEEVEEIDDDEEEEEEEEDDDEEEELDEDRTEKDVSELIEVEDDDIERLEHNDDNIEIDENMLDLDENVTAHLSPNIHNDIDEVEDVEKSSVSVPEVLIDDEEEEDETSIHETVEQHEVQKDEEEILEENQETDHIEEDYQEHSEPLEIDTEDTKCSYIAAECDGEENEDVVMEMDMGTCETMEDEVIEEEEDEEEEEEEIAPTDLSLPKTPVANQDIIINCKNIPRNISTVIPPVVPSPQPRLCPTYPPATPAHQPKSQHTSKFLESLLSSPRKCHETPRRTSSENDKGPAPLDLGVTSNRGAGSPTVSCSDETRKITRPAKESAEGEPKAKCQKVEDITLKNLLSRQPDATPHVTELDLSSVSKKEEVGESGRKSRLLELLTSEPSPVSISPTPLLDPLTQLKKVMSDPDIAVPDPLLVPRDRLQELVANPAKEIPRLLAHRPELRLPEALAYPNLLKDPDLLVVSLSHLQSLLQKPEKTVKDDDIACYSSLGAFLEWQRYQSQQQTAAVAKEILDTQLKQQQQQHHKQHQQQHQQQQQQELDAAAAAALNQMLWLPYLTQLEAAAVACGNNQEFLSLLNAVFPASYTQTGQPPPPPPYHFLAAMNPAVFNVSPNDYKSQMEFQQAIMLWQEAMVQASAANGLNNNNNNNTNNNNHRPAKTPVNNNFAKSYPNNANGRYPSQTSRKYNSISAARTSPITPNSFHSPPPPPSPQHRSANSHTPSQYLAGNGYATTSQLHHQYNMQRCRQTNSVNTPMSVPKQSKPDSILEGKINSAKSSVNCKSLFNLLSGPQAHQDSHQIQHQTQSLTPNASSVSRQQHSHLLAALGKPSNHSHLQGHPQLPPLTLPPSPLDLSGATKKTLTPKLKVKDHLVDPSHTPKLLKADPSPEVGSTTTHPHLWHPLFGSQKTSLNSPWRWTTVTVNGE